MAGYGRGFFGLFGGGGLVNAKVDTDKLAQKQDELLLTKATVVALDDAQDGSIILQGGANTYNYVGVESELLSVKTVVEEYQSMAQQPEIRKAVDIIVNDVVTCEEDETPVTVNLDKVDGISESIKESITECFKEVIHLMDFENTAYQKIRKWYVDGRQAYHVIVDPTNKKGGIKKLVMLDSRCIRPVYIVEKAMREGGIEAIESVTLKYYYNPNYNRNQFTGQSGTSQNFQPSQQELVFDDESIVYIDSGEEPLANGIVPGLLNPAIRPLNNLVTTEDATVIYAITRAPEKRAFYLDVGTLGKKSAEEYMTMMMGKFKNRNAYDRTTGKITGNAHLMGIAEDYWLPRREGQNATEIATVGGGNQLGEMDHVNYFREKLYDALMIPKSRLQEEGSINIGGSNLAEITQEELRFSKFCAGLRRRYSHFFMEFLRRQLILKGVTDEKDWNEKIKPFIKFEFTSDSYIREQQENAILNDRLASLNTVEPFVGSIFSIDYVMRNVLRMSDEEVKEQQTKIAEEKKKGLYPKVQADETGNYSGSDVSPLKFKPETIPFSGSTDDSI
ncbi:portal vertex protein of head [Salmonella phage SPTD1]|uniref:Portal protein n=1 Tax=Salmonella phage vB_STmST313_KE31 TaxID=3161181 RepID=A0AAU8GMF4_9CAUD|nr:portal vertex protein of head [Salmonella phage SPTD1]